VLGESFRTAAVSRDETRLFACVRGSLLKAREGRAGSGFSTIRRPSTRRQRPVCSMRSWKGTVIGTGSTFDWSLSRPSSPAALLAGGSSPTTWATPFAACARGRVDGDRGVEPQHNQGAAKIAAFIPRKGDMQM